jgi:hypothetical protein
MHLIMFLLIALLPCIASTGEETFDFPGENLDERIDALNVGDLEILDTPPQEPVHHHINRIRIRPDSLRDGWVELQQCHRYLDPVPRLEIVYHPERIRHIVLLTQENIGASRVVGPKIELKDVRHDASICLRAETHSLHPLGEGGYQLRNGPYMRRFLDGYFPMHLTLEVKYPAELIRFTALRPLPLDTGHARVDEGHLHWDGWFQGRLYTEIDFHRLQHDH